jgi:hypothetical protein
VSLNLQSIYRDQWVCTRYGKSSLYEGTEGELYNLAEDPGSLVNRWDDPAFQALKADLITDLDDSLPPAREPRLPRLAPV